MKATWAILIILTFLAMLVATGLLPGGFILGFILIIPVCYAVYLWALCFCIEGQAVAVEGTRLVKKGTDNRVIGAIDLSAPFEARCVFHGTAWALFKVKQGHRSLRFLVDVKQAERLARDALQLPWPGESRALWWL